MLRSEHRERGFNVHANLGGFLITAVTSMMSEIIAVSTLKCSSKRRDRSVATD